MVVSIPQRRKPSGVNPRGVLHPRQELLEYRIAPGRGDERHPAHNEDDELILDVGDPSTYIVCETAEDITRALETIAAAAPDA
jgi:hypothetical protein